MSGVKTAVAAPFHDDVTWDDCLEWIDWKPGQIDRFLLRMTKYDALSAERIGQAWFNSLRPEDAEKLRGTPLDPFFKDSQTAVMNALAYLLAS
jgi:hypothetical protein